MNAEKYSMPPLDGTAQKNILSADLDISPTAETSYKVGYEVKSNTSGQRFAQIIWANPTSGWNVALWDPNGNNQLDAFFNFGGDGSPRGQVYTAKYVIDLGTNEHYPEIV